MSTVEFIFDFTEMIENEVFRDPVQILVDVEDIYIDPIDSQVPHEYLLYHIVLDNILEQCILNIVNDLIFLLMSEPFVL